MGKPATKTPYVVVHKPVGVNCGQSKCNGIMMRKDLSRIEEGLGHEGFECNKCHRRVKYVPKER